MAAAYVYKAFTEPRNIRLLQVQFDPDYRRTFEDSLHQARAARTEVLDKSTETDPFEEDERAREEFQKNFSQQPCIRGRLVEASLDKMPFPYKAVSYVWGNPAKCHKIWMDGCSYLEVTESAMSLLLWIVETGFNGYFWMDALCINQNDNEEKGHQIPLMYDVYSTAEEVIAWTGESSKDSELALEFVPILKRALIPLRDAGAPFTRESVTSIKGCHWPSPRWTALDQFLQRPFFRRLWIVQEMVAAQNIRLVNGANECDWMDLADILAIVKAPALTYLIGSSEEAGDGATTDGAQGLVFTWQLRVQIKMMGKLPSLPYVLSSCEIFGATDPRDRVFALLNISDRDGYTAIKPDYNRSIEQVFTDTTRYMLSKTNPSISPLYSAGVGYERSLGKLPSWVPDWTTKFGDNSFGIAAEGNIEPDSNKYYASGKSFKFNTLTTHSNDMSMSFKGRIIDVVKSHYDGGPPVEREKNAEISEYAANYINWLLKLWHVFPDSFAYPTGTPFFPDALSHILVAGTDEDGHIQENSIDPDFVDFFATYLFFSESVGDGKVIPKIVIDRLDAIKSSEALRNAYQSCERYNGRIETRRRFFTTETSYAGLGPPLMEENDIICLIYGAKVPFIIRKRAEGGYLLVGECYVHGMMHGEGMTMGSEQEILLC